MGNGKYYSQSADCDAVTNTLALSGTNFFFSKLTDHGEKERKRHGLTIEKLQRDRDR